MLKIKIEAYNAHKKHCAGFSLVEMLMALLVASLLMAALAPVMTRKFGENVNVSGTGGAVIPKATCIRFNDTDSILEFNDENSGCIVPENTYNASAIIASGGGGGGGAAGLSESSSGFTNLVNTTSTSGTATIFNGATKSILVRIAGGGGGAGGGSYEVKENQIPEKQADCEPFGVFINATNNGGKAVCVSKYNPNDILFPPSAATKYASPPIPAGISIYQANGSDGLGKCENANCCWVPNNFSQFTGGTGCESPVTSTGNITDVGGMNYSGCHRTVCQWSAANKICTNWKPLGASGPTGRLPTKAEAEAWVNKGQLMDINGMPSALNWTRKGTAPGQGYGLQICHHSGGSDSAAMHCGAERNCAGAASNYSYAKNGCYIGYIWTSTSSSNGGHYELYGQGNTITVSFHPTVINNNADSVRCLVEKTNVNTPHIGGGGSSGTFVGIEVPKEVIARALELGNARIDTIAGEGGNGGDGASDIDTKAKDGKNGNSSKIAIYGGGGNTYNSGGTLLWSLEVPGGYGGNGATSTSDGEKGKSLTNPECKYFNIADQNYNSNKNGHTVFCKDLPKTAYAAGKDGGSGGEGGASAWSDGTSMVYSDGKGGKGGTCNVEDPLNVNCNSGENGIPGRIQALHIPAYPGVGGGGGGAGNVIHIVNFSVKKGDLIKVTVGHGGKGGAGFAGGNGNNGNDGGASFIELPNGTKYGVLGGKGGEGGKQGNPGSNTAPTPGKGGKTQGMMPDSNKVPGDYYFKGNEGQNALSLPQAFESILASAGGHGGINPKISGLSTRNETGGSNNNIPCGGLNTEKDIAVNDNLTWKGAEECSASDNAPLALTRTLYDTVFNETIIKDFALGATGGGGGGWAQGKSIPAQNGAAGLGGYVYIYFGNWSE